jgi:hypothetical protein
MPVPSRNARENARRTLAVDGGQILPESLEAIVKI